MRLMDITNPIRLFCKNALKHPVGSRFCIKYCCCMNKAVVTNIPSHNIQRVMGKSKLILNSKSSINSCSRPIIKQSNRPNKMAVDLTPILISSLRSAIAYSVSYMIDQITLVMNNHQTMLGSPPVSAAKTIGIAQPNAIPNTICGKCVMRLQKG